VADHPQPGRIWTVAGSERGLAAPGLVGAGQTRHFVAGVLLQLKAFSQLIIIAEVAPE